MITDDQLMARVGVLNQHHSKPFGLDMTFPAKARPAGVVASLLDGLV